MCNRQLQAEYEAAQDEWAEQQLADEEANAPLLKQQESFASFEDLYYEELEHREANAADDHYNDSDDGIVKPVDLNHV